MTIETNTQDTLSQDISTKEMAKLLNISEQTIYSLVKREEIVPINKNDWTIDGTYYFSPETVEKVKEMYRKPGLTNKDVAEMLGVSLSTAQKLIKTGKIPSFTAFYLGKQISFVQEEDLLDYMEHHQIESKTPIYHKETNTFLYQSFIHATTKEIARVMEITQEGIVRTKTERGTFLQLDELLEQGYVASDELKSMKAINKRGYAQFMFVKPSQLNSPIYKVLEQLFLFVGPYNMKVKEREDATIEVFVKPFLLPFNREEHGVEINLLQHNIIEGTVSVRHKGVMVDSDLETIHTVIPSHVKEKVAQVVREEEMTIEDFVKYCIEKELRARGLL